MEKSQSTNRTQTAEAQRKATLLSITNLKKYFPVAKSSLFAKQMYVRANEDISIDIYQGETFGLGFSVSLDIFLRIGKGVQHIVGRHLLQGPPVIHGAPCGLLIELEQHPAQGGLAAAGFPHQAESLPQLLF